MNQGHPCRSRSGLILGIVGTLFLFPIEARADETRLSNEGRAEQLFRSGEKKFDAGQHAEACVDFAESLKLGPKLGTLLNLALCHETIGKIATAWNEFHHGAAWAAQNSQKDRLEFALQHLRSLQPKLPRVVLQLPADRAVSQIDLDGEPLPEQLWYLPLYLDPGEHKIAVSAPGKQRTTVSFRVTAAPTDQMVAVPTLPDDKGASAPPSNNGSAAPSPTLYTVGFVMLGAGVIGLTAGTIFGIAALGADDVDSAKDLTLGSTISFLAGAAFAGVGGYLVLTNMPRDTKVMLGPNGLLFRGTF